MKEATGNLWTYPAHKEAPISTDVTTEVKTLLDNGGTAESIGYLCIQSYPGPNRICSGCTSACDQSVVVIFEKEGA